MSLIFLSHEPVDVPVMTETMNKRNKKQEGNDSALQETS